MCPQTFENSDTVTPHSVIASGGLTDLCGPLREEMARPAAETPMIIDHRDSTGQARAHACVCVGGLVSVHACACVCVYMYA